MKITAVLILCAGVLAVVAAAVASGVGQSPDWLPAGPARPLPDAHVAAVELPEVSLNSLDAAWRKPLFSPDRAPDQSTQGASADLAGLVLTGVVVNDDLKLALLRDGSGHALRVHQGQALPNGWTLQQLSPLEAQFAYQGQTRSLRLPAPRLPAPSRAAMLTLPPVTEP